MKNSLYKLFNNLDLTWIDNSEEIFTSHEFNALLSIFPNLENIFQDASDKDNEEFQRTIRHIFRLFKIFYSIQDGQPFHETLSQESLNTIRKKILKQDSQNELIIPIILIYHDIGRFIDKKHHPYHSYHIISTMNLLEPYKLSDVDQLLICKVIQYHLLFATIYTGESTYYGIYSLLNDPEFTELISKEIYIDRFIDILEIFTYIDILGYSYARIFDHYIKYYDEINYKLKMILRSWPDKESALMKAKEYSQEWLEWRIAGALRIFQFVETKPYLTKEFYFNKLKQSIKETDNEFISNLNWELIKKKFLVHSYKIQMKYSLALLMILAFGSFQRMGLKIDTGISYKLILFWALLSREVETRAKKKKNHLWNVFLVGMPHWTKINNSFINKLNDDAIELIVKNSTQNFDKNRKEFNLYLDFEPILS